MTKKATQMALLDGRGGKGSGFQSIYYKSRRLSLSRVDGKSGSVVKSLPGFDPWVRKIPWRRKWQPTPVSLPGKSHGQRSQS